MALPTGDVTPIAPPPPVEAAVTVPSVSIAPAAPAVPAVSQQTAVAPAEPPVAASGMVGAMQKAQELGFEGLDLSGFGAFPIVRLHRGSYNTRDGLNLGTTFYGFIQDGGTKQKFVYNNGLPDRDPGRDYFYTYDQVTTVKGEPVSQILDTWRARGWTPQISPYLDTMIKVHGGEHDGTMIILSVPKSSRPRLSVHIGSIIMDDQLPSAVVTRFSIAGEVGSGATAFTPMEFSKYTG